MNDFLKELADLLEKYNARITNETFDGELRIDLDILNGYGDVVDTEEFYGSKIEWPSLIARIRDEQER